MPGLQNLKLCGFKKGYVWGLHCPNYREDIRLTGSKKNVPD